MNGPMNPRRLARLRKLSPTTPPGFGMLHLSHRELQELLAAHDYWQAETLRLRECVADQQDDDEH